MQLFCHGRQRFREVHHASSWDETVNNNSLKRETRCLAGGLNLRGEPVSVRMYLCLRQRMCVCVCVCVCLCVCLYAHLLPALDGGVHCVHHVLADGELRDTHSGIGPYWSEDSKLQPW